MRNKDLFILSELLSDYFNVAFDVECLVCLWGGRDYTVIKYLNIDAVNLKSVWGAYRCPGRCENDPRTCEVKVACPAPFPHTPSHTPNPSP